MFQSSLTTKETGDDSHDLWSELFLLKNKYHLDGSLADLSLSRVILVESLWMSSPYHFDYYRKQQLFLKKMILMQVLKYHPGYLVRLLLLKCIVCSKFSSLSIYEALTIIVFAFLSFSCLFVSIIDTDRFTRPLKAR